MTLSNPHLLEEADEPYRSLWTWHALEELEHSAVALTVWKRVTRDSPAFRNYFRRIWALMFITGWIAHRLTLNSKAYLGRYGIGASLPFWRGYLRVLFVRPGYLRRGFGTYLRYFRPGFDPTRLRDGQLIEGGRARLSAFLGSPDGAAAIQSSVGTGE